MNKDERRITEIIEERVIEIYTNLTEGEEKRVIETNNFFRTGFGQDFHYEFLEF